jgi:predicted DNA-binding transcriptional regulator AlpA
MNLQTYAQLMASCFPTAAPPPDPHQPPPLVVDAAWIAAAFSVSLRTVRRWDKDGNLPSPLVVERCIRWRRQEILDWCNAGMPPRLEWEAKRAVCSPR